MSFLRPVASTALAHRASSNALTVVRAMIGTPGRASVSSGMIPNFSLRLKYNATFALWMMFLLGRHAMFGQEPPTYFRSITAVFILFLASVQERSFPAAPLPRMKRLRGVRLGRTGRRRDAGDRYLPDPQEDERRCLSILLYGLHREPGSRPA